MQDIQNWTDYLYFLKVAERGSLQAAATELSVNNSTVFRRINALEEKLSVRLFERLKTGYQLTEAGREIIDQVRQVELQMHAIHRSLHGKNLHLHGTIRVSTTDTIGYYWLPALLARFKEEYPEITLDIEIRNRFTDLAANEADVVIPAVNTQPDYMVGRKLASIRIQLCATRKYLEQYGAPGSFQDLLQHRFIAPSKSLEGLPAYKWLRQYIDENNIMACSNKLTGLMHLARQSLGITLLPHYVIEAEPELQSILEMPKRFLMHIWILTHPDLRDSGKIRTFLQYMYNCTKES